MEALLGIGWVGALAFLSIAIYWVLKKRSSLTGKSPLSGSLRPTLKAFAIAFFLYAIVMIGIGFMAGQ